MTTYLQANSVLRKYKNLLLKNTTEKPYAIMSGTMSEALMYIWYLK